MKARRESIQAPADTALTVFELPPEAFGCPFHFHPEAELVFISKGRGLRLIGDHLEAFRSGDLCLIGPDFPHFYRADEGVEAAALVAQFPVEPLTRLAAGFPKTCPISTAVSGNTTLAVPGATGRKSRPRRLSKKVSVFKISGGDFSRAISDTRRFNHSTAPPLHHSNHDQKKRCDALLAGGDIEPLRPLP